MPAFSLILATLGRRLEVQRFLESLAVQDTNDFEVLVVDQNPVGWLDNVIAPFQEGLSIRQIPSAPGLSRARNLGLNHASGEFIAFPDDDCWYPNGLLERVRTYLESTPNVAGVTGRPVDENGERGTGRSLQDRAVIDKSNVWLGGISFTIFLRKAACDDVGGFDESLGLGAASPWQSGEETDYLIRIVESGHTVQYLPDLVVHHPVPEASYDDRAQARARAYGRGMGRVLAKHDYRLSTRAQACIRPMGGAILAVLGGDWGRAKYHQQVLAGRLEGMRAR